VIIPEPVVRLVLRTIRLFDAHPGDVVIANQLNTMNERSDQRFLHDEFLQESTITRHM
jgi:hypothetical protein